MPEVIITVHGEYLALLPAERVTVHASAHTDGDDRNCVFAAAVSASDSLRGLVGVGFNEKERPITA